MTRSEARTYLAQSTTSTPAHTRELLARAMVPALSPNVSRETAVANLRILAATAFNEADRLAQDRGKDKRVAA